MLIDHLDSRLAGVWLAGVWLAGVWRLRLNGHRVQMAHCSDGLEPFRRRELGAERLHR